MTNMVPVQTYYVPVREDDTVLIGDGTGHVEIGKGTSLQDVDTFSLISFGVAAEGTIITYDNWEDGYEFDVTNPAQASTYVWGDGDASNNGVYIAALDRNGDNVISDDEDHFLGGEAFNITDIVDLQRSSSDLFFDASDKISASFPIAVSRLTAPMERSNDSDPSNDSIRNIATGAVEVQDTSKYGDSYVIPVGGDGTGNTDAPTGAFDLAFAHVMAEQNGTAVYFNGTLIDTIDAGETVVRQVVQGDEITTYDPAAGSDGPGVQVTLITRDDGSEDNEQRWYSLSPTDDWSNDYVTPVGVGVDFGTSSRGESAVWLYNNGSHEIEVVMSYRDPATDTIKTKTIDVPAGGSVLSPTIPDGSGARFTSDADDPFYAVLQVDVLNGGERNDWGHPLIPVEQLTSQGLITFGYGNTSQLTGGNSFESRSLTFVTPLENATINVDFDGDGTVDKTISAKALESVTITDPTDKNMTGAMIFATDAAGKPVDIAIAHGQDPGESAPESQSIDAGVVTLPLPEVFTSKSSALAVDADGNGVYSTGDTVEFTINTLNFGRIDIGEGGYVVVDELASFSAHLDYVAGSAAFDLSDGRGAITLAGTDFPFDQGFSTLGRGDGSADSAVLNVGETHTLTFRAVIKDFADLPTGTVGFENTGELQTNSGGLINDFSTNAPIVFDAGVSIEKATNGVDADTGTGPSITIGSSVTWRYAVSNDGETFLAAVDVTDDQGETPVYVSGDANSNDMIDPGETWIYEATGTAEAGQYRNIGTVTATPTYADGSAVPVSAGGGMVTASDPSGYFGASNPSIAFDKIVIDVAGKGADGTLTEAGQNVTYKLVVTNDGDIDLSNVTVVDPLTGTAETIAKLAAGEEQSFEVTYTVTQADFDNNGGGDGDIDNTATADANETGPVSDSEAVDLEAAAAILLDKQVTAVDAAGDGVLNAAGEIVTYDLVVTNGGNTTLTGVTVKDPLTGADVAIGTLAPGQSETVATSYTVTQADFDNNGGGDGDIDNTATADANETGPVSDSEAVDLEAAAAILLDKQVTAVDAAGDGVLNAAGEIVTYDLVVTNGGNTTLTGVTVKDPLTGADVAIGTLAPGQSETVATSYKLTQKDLNNNGGGDGDIDNTATANANEVDPVSDSEAVEIERNPSLLLQKTVTAVDAAGDGIANVAGNIIEYALTVTNTGNVVLNQVSVVDPLTGTSELVGKLRPGHSATVDASYALTEEDLSTNGGGDGDIDNIAYATSNQTDEVSDEASVDLVLPPICTDIADLFVKPKHKDATIEIGDNNKNGTNGDDIIFGDKGSNTISTNGGENAVRALAGNDIVNGGNEADLIFGEGGADILNGNSGDDLISGGGGADRIYGAGGDDKIIAGRGRDLVEAGDGRDIIDLGHGNDTVQGEGGDDCIAGGKDHGRIRGSESKGFNVNVGDELFGNGGADKFEYMKGDGVDFLFDFKSEDGDSLIFVGVDESMVDAIVGNTAYGPAAGLAIDHNGDGKYDGGVFFQQIRDPDDLTQMMQSGEIDFII